MRIDTVISFSDCTWYNGTWGEQGMRRLVDQCTQWGMRKVYLRVFNGGLALYKSRVAEIQHGLKDHTFPGYNEIVADWDFQTWDMLGSAVDQARKRGIELHAWFTFLEDNHGGPFESRFCAEHPEFHLKARDGVPQGDQRALSFVFPEVRAYKLSIVEELLSFGVDGIYLDFMRNSGSIRYQDKVWLFGYEEPAIASFREIHGADPLELPLGDPRWLDHRSRYMTDFLRDVKEKARSSGRPCELCAHLGFLEPEDYADPWCFKKSRALDVESMVAEGLVDRCCLHAFASSTEYNNHMTDLRFMVPTMRSALKLRCPVGVALYSYWDLSPDMLEAKAAECAEAGVEDMVLFEVDMIQRMDLGAVISRQNLGKIGPKRSIRCRKAEGLITDVDWERAEEINGFIAGRWLDKVIPPELAETRTLCAFLMDCESLHVRFLCEEPEVRELSIHSWKRSDPVTGLTGKDDSVELCLDVEHDHMDYFRFAANAGGTQVDAKRSDSRWDGEWSAKASVGEKGFEVSMSIPFSTLGRIPNAGDRWGFNLLRHRRGGRFWGGNQSSATSFIVPCTGSGSEPQPSGYGHLVFE